MYIKGTIRPGETSLIDRAPTLDCLLMARPWNVAPRDAGTGGAMKELVARTAARSMAQLLRDDTRDFAAPEPPRARRAWPLSRSGIRYHEPLVGEAMTLEKDLSTGPMLGFGACCDDGGTRREKSRLPGVSDSESPPANHFDQRGSIEPEQLSGFVLVSARASEGLDDEVVLVALDARIEVDSLFGQRVRKGSNG